jgi:type IV pilus assembly protein PilX
MNEDTPMPSSPLSTFTPRHRQHGFVLIVALVLLLVLTLLGLAAAQSTSLQERMAGNARNQDLAFQAAEAGLRAGEGCLATAVCSNFTANTGGTYAFNASSIPALPLWKQPGFWATAGNVMTYPAVVATNVPAVAAQPAFVIEQMPPMAVPGGNIGQQQYAGGAPTIQLFRVTALGTGGDSNSQIMLQSMWGP